MKQKQRNDGTEQQQQLLRIPVGYLQVQLENWTRNTANGYSGSWTRDLSGFWQVP